MARVGEPDRLMARDGFFPPNKIAARRSRVFERPEDECLLVRQARQACFKLREVVGCGDDLPRIEGGDAAAVRREKRAQVNIDYIGGRLRTTSCWSPATRSRVPPGTMAYCAHQDVSFLVRAVHSRQTELPLGKSALASLGHLSKRTFLFPAVLRSESCSRAELPVVLDAAP
jgi:hypothetical protein